MKKSAFWFDKYLTNVYSQNGEDGLIQYILQKLPRNDKWCVEFGAWDGLHLSNTANLTLNHSYSAILIEGSTSKYREIVANYLDNPKVYPLNIYVGIDKENSLDQILKNYKIPKEFDFLSIDIDGNDYHVWRRLIDYKPKIVCVEFNSSIPSNVEFIQTPSREINHGSSILSLTKLGKDKNYELVAIVGTNAVFVNKKYYKYLNITDNSIDKLRDNLSHVTNLFYGYDGTVFISGNTDLPWHNGIKLKLANIQPLPKYIRRYPPTYNILQKLLFVTFLFFNNSKALSYNLRDYLTKAKKTSLNN